MLDTWGPAIAGSLLQELWSNGPGRAVKDRRCLSDLIMPAQMELRNQGLNLMTVHRKWWNEFFIPGVNKNGFRSKSLSGGDDFGT